MLKSKAVILIGVLAISGDASADLNTGLLGYWNFDNCTAVDASGHGRNGVINGDPQCVDGILNKSFSFLGAMEENIKIDTFPQIKKSLSISAWINPNGFQFEINPIVTRGESSQEAYTLWASYNSVSLLLNWNSPEQIWCTAPVNIKDNKFYHVAATYNYNLGKVSLYMNGKRVGGCSYTSELYAQTEPLYISSSYPGSEEYFKGIIDELRVYNRALTATEVQALYYQGNPPSIEGTALWLTPHVVTCENTTQNTTVTIPETKTSAWNCEKAGLPVKSGDKIKVTIEGKKY